MVLWFILMFVVFRNMEATDKNNVSNENMPLIYKGYGVGIEQYSYAVFLHFEKTRPKSCGGSLIFVQTVLTAAHCVDELRIKKGKIRVHFGSTIPRDASVVRDVVAYEISPNYHEKTGKNNIAVLFLDGPVPLRHEIKKIMMEKKEPPIGTVLYSVGWGKQNVGNRPYKPTDFSSYRSLRATKQILLSKAECERYAGIQIGNTICTRPIMGHHYKDDAGDGLVLKKPDGVVTLIGVLSFVAHGVSFYTNVGSGRDWIVQASWRLFNKVCKEVAV